MAAIYQLQHGGPIDTEEVNTPLIRLLQRASFALVKGRRMIAFTFLGYATIMMASVWSAPRSLQQPGARAQIFSREFQLPFVWIEVGSAAFLFVVYFSTLLNWQRLTISTRELVTVIAGVMILACLSVPGLTSLDLISYIGLGRLAAVHHLNPYLHTYREVHDFYSTWAWFRSEMPYGPIVLLAFLLPGVISSFDVWAAIYSLKAEWVLVFALSCWVLFRLLRDMNADARYGLFVLALNPLVVLELLVAGHNDGLVILFMLLALLFAHRQRIDVALYMAMLGVLSKVSGIILFALLIALAIRQKKWKQVGAGLLGSLIIAAVMATTILPTQKTWYAMTNPTTVFNWNSVYGWVVPLTHAEPGSDSFLGMRLIATILFLGVCVWRAFKVSGFSTLVNENIYLTCALLVIFSGAFFPWYITWLVPYAALTSSPRLRAAVLLYTVSVLWLYAIPLYWTAHNLGLRVVRWALTHVPALTTLLKVSTSRNEKETTLTFNQQS